MTSSIYTPLEGDSRRFRLLFLEPSTDRLAPLRCELNRASFDNEDVKYTALSYTWGDPIATTPIFVNGVETQVTLNLEAALRHIRQITDSITLWVDALCINQEDLAEKNHQVEMMRDIFSGAELVIAWLGSAGEDSDLAMAVFGKGLKALMESEGARRESDEDDGVNYSDSLMVRDGHGVGLSSECQEEDITAPLPQKAAVAGPQLQKHTALATSALPNLVSEHREKHHVTDQPSAFSNSGSFISRESTSRDDSHSFDEYLGSKDPLEQSKDHIMALKQLPTRDILAMRKLLQRSWWRRIWVVQEVLLAKKIIFKCGNAEVLGQQMSSWRDDALVVLNTLGAAHDSDCTGSIFPALSLIGTLRDPINEEQNPRLYFVLYSTGEATRPHDHIYGLFGLIPASHRDMLGAPDYGCKAEDLFIKVATKLMVVDNSLELLRLAGLSAPPRTSSPKRMSLPSWVPDWTTQNLKFGSLVDMFELTAPFPEHVFSFSEDFTELTVTGCNLDVIESMQSMPKLAQGKMPMWQSVLTTKECTRDDRGPPPLQGLVNVLLHANWTDEEPEPRVFCLFASFLQELEEYRISVSRDEARGGQENPSHLAGFLHWTGETRDGRTDEEILQKVCSAETARSFSEWYHRQSSTDLQVGYMYYSIVRDGLFGNAGYSIFRTSKGFLGTTHAAVVMGDLICVVPGCLAPLVLRKVGFSKYVLLGSICWLYGLTSDALTQAVRKSEIMMETFTLV